MQMGCWIHRMSDALEHTKMYGEPLNNIVTLFFIDFGSDSWIPASASPNPQQTTTEPAPAQTELANPEHKTETKQTITPPTVTSENTNSQSEASADKVQKRVLLWIK